VSAPLSARATQAVDPDEARRAAQHILSDGRFRSSSTPRPLRGPLRWIGDRLGAVFSPVGRFLERIPGAVWISVLIGVVALIIVLVVRARHRLAARVPTAKSKGVRIEAEAEDPDSLERAADEAEHDGDLARAVRLRFRAGLLRLGNRGAIRYRPSVTTGEVRRTLSSNTFDELAGTFEAVTYGGRTAAQPDVDNARRAWPRVLEETGRR
jgi:hypothetical protein